MRARGEGECGRETYREVRRHLLEASVHTHASHLRAYSRFTRIDMYCEGERGVREREKEG